jgi:DnaJ-like protein/PilZ domain-containing protein
MNTDGLIHTGELLRQLSARVGKRESTEKLISQHYLDIEYLLQRVESSSNHYQTLGIERTATSDQIVSSYQQAVRVLHPGYHKVRYSMPDEMLSRIDQTFEKLSKAFTLLINQGKRAKYDRSMRWRAYQTSPHSEPKANLSRASRSALPGQDSTEESSETIDEVGADNVNSIALPPAHIRPALGGRQNTRRCERSKLDVPVLVTGYDSAKERWQEITRSVDVSRLGVGIRVHKRLSHGAVVHVTLPLPSELRSHTLGETGYSMYAIVRRVEPVEDDLHLVGLEFIGAQPPRGYLHKPWATFRTQQWNGPDRRREPRQERVERVAIEYLDKLMQPIAREVAVTENVSLCGARVRVKSAPQEFEIVRISTSARSFESLALVRNRYADSDGVERLCIQFVQSKWPIGA